MRMLVVAALTTMIGACGIPEESFPSAYGKQVCKRFEECQPTEFEAVYDSLSDCTETTADAVEAAMNVADLAGATYDPAKARDCVSEAGDTECGATGLDEFACELWE